MSTEKITVTDQLRSDIVQRRKEVEFTAALLSERSGHSKYWLSNIENGKTKKITENDLLTLYSILLNEDEYEPIAECLENILNQPLTNTNKNWYDLIKIEKHYSATMNRNELDGLFRDLIYDIHNRINGQYENSSVHIRQAILTTLLHLQRTLIVNPSLAFTLFYVPTYCTEEKKNNEYNSVLGDILALAAKFNDLAHKNDSLNVVSQYIKAEKQKLENDKKNVISALENFNSILNVIVSLDGAKYPKLGNVCRLFYSSVVDIIKKVDKDIVGDFIPYIFHINSGNDFKYLVADCKCWFSTQCQRLSISNFDEYIPEDLFKSAQKVLESIPTLET